ncbi:MAG: GNAT family N-acetyltransferase [bacterium]
MEILKVDLSDQNIIKQIAVCYQKTFGEHPWHEGYRCPKCNKSFSLMCAKKLCDHCNHELVLYWPLDKIETDFMYEMTKDNAICYVAKMNDEIIGFAWGYQVILNQEFDLYVNAPGLSMQFENRNFFYLDEIGIIPNCQCKGIGKKLAFEIFNSQSYNVLLRTLNNTQMSSMIERMGGENIFNLPDSQKIIMKLDLV